MKRRLLLALGLAAAAGPALAHHSFAMFDSSKTVVLQGKVKEMQWTNPHAWLQVLVPSANGGVVEWSFEMEGPQRMQREGWKKSSVKPGDQITVSASPLRDGRPGGAFRGIILADGSTLGRPITQAAAN